MVQVIPRPVIANSECIIVFSPESVECVVSKRQATFGEWARPWFSRKGRKGQQNLCARCDRVEVEGLPFLALESLFDDLVMLLSYRLGEFLRSGVTRLEVVQLVAVDLADLVRIVLDLGPGADLAL